MIQRIFPTTSARRPFATLLVGLALLVLIGLPAATPSSAAETPTWHAEFFTNPTLSGAAALVREDAAIDFDWGLGTPDPAIPIDNFSARWTRTLTLAAGTYRFVTYTDDGIRVKIDGVNSASLDHLIIQDPTYYQFETTLAAGNHTFEVEYFAGYGNALAKFTWACKAAAGEGIFRINAGGLAPNGEYADSFNNFWEPDNYYVNNNPTAPLTTTISEEAQPIWNTTDDQLYINEHATAFRYQLPVPNGNYTVSVLLAAFLQDEGYRVTRSSDGVGGLNLVRRTQPDLIILDADLPGIDGITLAGAIRTQATTPIILFIDGTDELQQVIGLDRGADLCMTKPISLAELRARLRALLRRAERNKSPRAQALTIGDLRIDPHMRRAWLHDQELQLTPKEFELLIYLMRNRGVVVPRDQLLRDVWGGRVPARAQTLDVHIRWLRQKVEPNPENPVYIQTVRMIGYRFEGP